MPSTSDPSTTAVFQAAEDRLLHGEESTSLQTLVAKCRAKGLGGSGPVVPPTQENLKQAIADGYNMIILGNDMWHFQKALKELVNDQVAPVRKELLGE